MQTKKCSFVEACFNVGSGFIIAILTWEFIITPIFNLHKPFLEDLGIVIIFTIISIIRSYVWRRIFNKTDK